MSGTLAKITGMVRHRRAASSWPVSDWKDKILHARIAIGGAVDGSRCPQAEPMRSAYLTLTLDTEPEAERVYAVLTEGREVFMKMEKTHFANRFAMLRDRFGTS